MKSVTGLRSLILDRGAESAIHVHLFGLGVVVLLGHHSFFLVVRLYGHRAPALDLASEGESASFGVLNSLLSGTMHST